MLINIALMVVSLQVGVLIGAVGIGGVLLAPALMVIADMGVKQSMATALLTFVFTGITGTIFFHRRGSIDWTLVGPLCSGAVLAGAAGAWANTMLQPQALSILLGLVVIAAGASALKGSPGNPEMKRSNAQRDKAKLVVIGAIAGFISGIAGVGGPVVSVPLMLLCGFPVLAAVGVSQVLQTVVALSGTAANLHFGSIDFVLASYLTVFEVAGVVLGVSLVHRINASTAKKMVGGVCLLTGLVLIWRNLS